MQQWWWSIAGVKTCRLFSPPLMWWLHAVSAVRPWSAKGGWGVVQASHLLTQQQHAGMWRFERLLFPPSSCTPSRWSQMNMTLMLPCACYHDVCLPTPTPQTDVMYVQELVPPLLQSLLSLTDSNTTVLIAHGRNRWAEPDFKAAAAQHFSIELVPGCELDAVYQCSDVDVLRLRRLVAE